MNKFDKTSQEIHYHLIILIKNKKYKYNQGQLKIKIIIIRILGNNLNQPNKIVKRNYRTNTMKIN